MIDINQQRKENSKQIVADSQYNQIFSPPTNRLTEMNLSGTKTDLKGEIHMEITAVNIKRV